MKTLEPIVDASFRAVINAPLHLINLPEWVFSLTAAEYQHCAPAAVAAGQTTGSNGQRMVINVELIGGSPVVQRYQERLSEPHHLVLTSFSDVFAPTGRHRLHVRWELSVNALGTGQCELTNRVVVHPTDEMRRSLELQGISLEQFRAQQRPICLDHHRTATPQLAACLERAALFY
jgi:hypothetical protein